MSANVYDEVRYSNYPYAQTHPDRLATVAILHGLEPPDPFRARVLEVGCGAGGNLMAMAAATPGIRALGIDLAAAPIAEGQNAIREIGLGNVELRRADVRGLTPQDLGEFDYIVAHGVYGWIPEDARDALMAAIAALLSPAGLAYVSYNAHPGGYLRRLLRDVGLWHARALSGEAERAAKAQELYRFLKEHRMTTADTWGAVLEREVPVLADGPIYRLVHDDLSEHWHPVWFNEFAEHAARHGLDFVGEADMFSLRTEMLPDGVEPEVWKLAGGDRIAFETYSDLLTARHFRQSVICRAGAPVQVDPSPERAQRLWWAVRPNAEPLEAGLLPEAFALLDRARPRALGFEDLRTALGADPHTLGETLIDGFRRERLMPHAGPLRVALEAGERPRASALALLDRARPRALGFEDLQAALGADPHTLGETLIDGFRRERLMPHAGPLRVALEAGERPRASALARWQAARGADITSLVYLTVRMEEPAARLLITLLDGTRDRAAIRAELQARAGLELAPEDLDRNLHELARLFLLEP